MVSAAILISAVSANVFANELTCLRELSSMDRIVSDYWAVARQCAELERGSANFARAQSLAREIEDIYPSMLRDCFRECSYSGFTQRTACTHSLYGACR